MNYKYEIINYDKNSPAKIMFLDLSSDTHKTELHWHREPEIVYVLEGQLECPRNGETNYASAGEVVIFNSEDVHLVRPKKGCRAKMILIQLSFDYMRLFCPNLDNLIFSLEDRPKAAEKLISVFNKIEKIDFAHDDFALLMQISCINELYYTLFKYCSKLKMASNTVIIPKRDFSYAKAAIAYINENYKHEITLTEISNLVSLSPSYFSKYFKNVTQVSFSDYLANLRLENAIQDMITKNSTVTAASAENGFANVKSFITQCKKVYGYTPAQYKKKLLHNN